MGDKYKQRYDNKSGKQNNSQETISPKEFQRRIEFYKKRAEEQQREREEQLKQEKLAQENQEKEHKGKEEQKPLGGDTSTRQDTPTKKQDLPFQELSTEEQFIILEEQRRQRWIAEGKISPPTKDKKEETSPKKQPNEQLDTLQQKTKVPDTTGSPDKDKKETSDTLRSHPLKSTKQKTTKQTMSESGTELKQGTQPNTDKLGNTKGTKTPSPTPKTDTTGNAPKEEVKEVPQEKEKKKKDIQLDKSSSEGFINSLTSLPVSDLAEGLKQKTEAGSILKGESDDVKKKTEEKHRQPAPTGLSADDSQKRESKQKKAAKLQEVGKVRGVNVKDNPQGKAVKEGHTTQKPGVPESQSPLQVARRFFDKLFSWFGSGSVQATVQKSLHQLPTKDNSVNTSPGTVPKVDLEGKEAPDRQNQQLQQEKDQETDTAHQKAQNEPNKDFGENDIYPEDKKEELNPNFEFSPSPETSLTQLNPEGIPTLSSEAEAHLNQSMQGQIGGKTEQEKAKITKAKQDKETGFKKANEEHELSVEKKIEETTAAQTQAQLKANAEVDSQREQWKKENDDILKNYEDESGKERQKVDSQVQKKTDDTNAEVKQKYREAQQKAEAQKRAKEKEAEAKKAEADKKEPSFWDRAVNAVKGFFEGLKKAINFIFDQLRKAVKAIIEGVKKLANGLIELARKAIVGMIKAFGEALKALVTVALAAFPKLAKRINALIDKAVNLAVKAVNTLAEGLKKAVNALLDVLGKALDAVLALYQKMYNLVLDALEFIAVGIIEIMRGIANLISAARRSPDYFWGQMSEELLGADITKPLPGEVVVKDTKDAVKAAEEQGKITQQDTQVLKKTKLEAKDVKVDPVVQNPILSPELQKLIAGLPEGKELEFGEQPDLDQKKNVETIKQEAAGVASTEAKNAQATNTNQTSTTTTDTKQTQGSTKEGQIGPFAGPMERLGYLTGTMKKAVSEWWTKNKVTVIIGLVAGIAGLILANIATGGAIMAALPLLLQIVGAIFTGIGILDMAKHFGKYLSQAFPDKTIAGGAKSLARGLAALTIELIFSLLFGGKALLKSAKKGIKTVAKKGVKGAVKAGTKAARKSAVKGIKNTAQNFKDLGGVARDGWGALMKNGKMIFSGAKRGVISGAKTLDDVAKRLAKKFRFKKFKIVIKKRRFQILGEFNPWVLLADGKVVEVDQKDLPRGKTAKLGDSVIYKPKGASKGEHGYIIGEKTYAGGKGSSFVEDLRDSVKQADLDAVKTGKKPKYTKNKNVYDKLKKKGAGKTGNDARYKYISNNSGVPRNPHFRENYFAYLKKQHGIELSDNAARLLNVHHVAPNFLKGIDKLQTFLKNKMKFDIDELRNSIGLPTVDVKGLRETIKELEDLSKLSKLKASQTVRKADLDKKLNDALAKIKDKHKLDLNPSELDDALKELKRYEGRSVHEGYHTAYSKAVEKNLKLFAQRYEKATSDKVRDIIKGEFDTYITTLKTKLRNGEIALP
ncbi:hypothetical protein [Microscilla marina]|uniref:Uncharacterized protein n=1 Tax=Microscilla marina ATCC 23134 TaxID=313606 RepID=A1ZMA7_MICM2|nr:hypothetical protein [Microscilla marina]EAY28639.1 hypothetical protein M23134_04486 [Microscilla marina ATCC 23134]